MKIDVLGHGLSPGTNVQLLVNAADVSIHGMDANGHRLGYFLVKETPREHFQDFAFARGEIVILFGLGRRIGETLGDPAGNVAGHGRASRMDVFEGGEQFIVRRLLEQIASGAGLQRVKDMVGVFIYRVHDELGQRHMRFELPDAFDATQAGQFDVHQDDIRLLPGQILEAVFGAPKSADKFKAFGMSKPIHQDFPGRRVIFNNRNADGH